MIIAVAAAVLCDFGLLRTKLLRRKAFWTAYAILFCFQIVVNGILTGLPVVRYYPEAIFGPRIVNAPVEDVGFGFALILLTLSSWVALGRRR
jgi:lycopene cyclase domain-containing protein